MKFEETTLNSILTKDLIDDGIDWTAGYTPAIYKFIFEGTAAYLGKVKSMDDGVPHAIVIRNGDYMNCIGAAEKNKTAPIIFAAIVSKQKNDDIESYALKYTFNEKDIPENAKIVDFNDPVAVADLAATAHYKFTILFRPVENGIDYMTHVSLTAIRSLKKWYNENVNIDPVLELKDYFKMSGSVEDGKVKIVVTPSELLKQHVKDDKSLEKKKKVEDSKSAA
jgi:hypothetical protein|nr:MAG TPA: hypothetical protein [Caudoviricetes sp.]